LGILGHPVDSFLFEISPPQKLTKAAETCWFSNRNLQIPQDYDINGENKPKYWLFLSPSGELEP